VLIEGESKNHEVFRHAQKSEEKKHPRIRRRVFAYLAAFVAFVLALLWLMQIVWLDDFYRWDKTRQITQAADAVESNIGNEQLSALMTGSRSRMTSASSCWTAASMCFCRRMTFITASSTA